MICFLLVCENACECMSAEEQNVTRKTIEEAPALYATADFENLPCLLQLFWITADDKLSVC